IYRTLARGSVISPAVLAALTTGLDNVIHVWGHRSALPRGLCVGKPAQLTHPDEEPEVARTHCRSGHQMGLITVRERPVDKRGLRHHVAFQRAGELLRALFQTPEDVRSFQV